MQGAFLLEIRYHATIRPMSAAPKDPVVLHADQEHGGIRLTIFVALFLGFLLGFRVIAWLLERFAPPPVADYTTFLACVGAVPLALLMIWGLERLLKRYWHSGLSLELDDRGITVHDRRRGQAPVETEFLGRNLVSGPALLWSANLSQLNWYFMLSGYPRGGRERRMPAKWFCVATELYNPDDEQGGGGRLNVYAFMPPDKAAAWIENPRHAFVRLNPVEIYDTSVRSRIGPPSRPAIPNSLLHAKEGRHWLAERRRWEYGIELTPDDFAVLMNYAQAAKTSQPQPTLTSEV
ncbi:hypothetical protein [Promineifilum sp.]|uniref:hypothetical protein n=1 Tax=Promineifilum sp. TaxID=2664178 RepID=UPI0035B39E92